MVKYLTGPPGEAQVTKIHYTSIDKEANWERVATAVAGQARQHISINLQFEAFDVEDAACARPSLADADLVIASYFVSEIAQVSQRQTARGNVTAMLKTMKSGSFLLYNDSKSPPFLTMLREIVRHAGRLTEIIERDQPFTASADGQHRIMQHYATPFSYRPRRKINAVSKLYRRV